MWNDPYNTPWVRGSSYHIPIYSGLNGCLNHWISWNRGNMPHSDNLLALPSPPSAGDNAVDITPTTDIND